MRVAICQDSIVAGGRLRVILGFVQALNELGIKPDIFTAQLLLAWDQIGEKYQTQADANIVQVRQFTRPQDLAITYFNWRLRWHSRSYDLLINTTNSLIFLPKQKHVLTYMFLPRKFWISTDVWNNHLPEEPMRILSKRWTYRKLLRLLYKMSVPQPHHQIVSMTKYVKELLLSAHPHLTKEAIPVIYPPVELGKFYSQQNSRLEQVVTIGRFASDKRQFEQIRLAEQCPHIPFHIVGFVSNQKYFDMCRQYVRERKWRHVHLHPNASFDEMLGLLQNSRYFLHTLVNEEFGITAVQAIAAGCIPIVHDSGGQRETVPEASLRYQSLDQVPHILSNLHGMDESTQGELIGRLQAHAFAHFDQRIFVEKTVAILEQYIKH